MGRVFLTVFTPTYNRAYKLTNLYSSLCRQTDFDFEWLIVDDGSTDNTFELIESFIVNNNRFKIRYYHKENGGKHTAINKGVELAEGIMFFIVDSDDTLTEDAVEKIKFWESTISSNSNFAGVAGNKGFDKQHIIGDTFDGDYIDATSLERDKLNIIGDKAEVFYTGILKKYKFPEICGEKFITEKVIWNKIAYDGYKIRWHNKIIYIAEYLEDGLFIRYLDLLSNNPKGFALSILQDIQFYNYAFKDKWNLYCFYLANVKDKIGLIEAANNLKLNKVRVCVLWGYYQFKNKAFRIIKWCKKH